MSATFQLNRKRIGRGLLLLATVAILVIILEIIARQFFPYGAPYHMPDPVLGWRLPANTEIQRHHPEYNVTVTTNSHGWRDVEHAYSKPAGTFRILVLGDSFMEGFGVKIADSMPRQLEELIRDSGNSEVEVINLGVSDYGTLQEYLAFVDPGISYEPDVVILAFHAENDVRNNSLALEAKFYEDNDYRVIGRPFLDPAHMDTFQITPVDYEHSVEAFNDRWWWQNTALYGFYERVVNHFKLKNIDSNIWLGIYLCEESADYSEAWQVTERIFQQLDATVSDSGATLMVITAPSFAEATAEGLEDMLKFVDKPENFCFENDPANTRIVEILARNEILYADLLPALREADRAGEQRIYFRKDQHWTPAGHRLAAEITLQGLREYNLLPD